MGQRYNPKTGKYEYVQDPINGAVGQGATAQAQGYHNLDGGWDGVPVAGTNAAGQRVQFQGGQTPEAAKLAQAQAALASRGQPPGSSTTPATPGTAPATPDVPAPALTHSTFFRPAAQPTTASGQASTIPSTGPLAALRSPTAPSSDAYLTQQSQRIESAFGTQGSGPGGYGKIGQTTADPYQSGGNLQGTTALPNGGFVTIGGTDWAGTNAPADGGTGIVTDGIPQAKNANGDFVPAVAGPPTATPTVRDVRSTTGLGSITPTTPATLPLRPTDPAATGAGRPLPDFQNPAISPGLAGALAGTPAGIAAPFTTDPAPNPSGQPVSSGSQAGLAARQAVGSALRGVGNAVDATTGAVGSVLSNVGDFATTLTGGTAASPQDRQSAEVNTVDSYMANNRSAATNLNDPTRPAGTPTPRMAGGYNLDAMGASPSNANTPVATENDGPANTSPAAQSPSTPSPTSPALTHDTFFNTDSGTSTADTSANPFSTPTKLDLTSTAAPDATANSPLNKIADSPATPATPATPVAPADPTPTDTGVRGPANPNPGAAAMQQQQAKDEEESEEATEQFAAGDRADQEDNELKRRQWLSQNSASSPLNALFA